MQEIARGITGQSFHYKAPPGTPSADTMALPTLVGTYPSQAERTYAKYEGHGSPSCTAKTPYERIPHKCFGCRAPSHGNQDKDGNITSPHGHDPSVKANAEREYRAYCEHLANKYKARMAKFRARVCSGSGCSGGCTSSESALDYHKLSVEDQKVLVAQAKQNTKLVFMLTAQLGTVSIVASIDAPPCHTLPTEIHISRISSSSSVPP